MYRQLVTGNRVGIQLVFTYVARYRIVRRKRVGQRGMRQREAIGPCFSTTNTLRPPAFITYPGNRSQEGLFNGQNRVTVPENTSLVFRARLTGNVPPRINKKKPPCLSLHHIIACPRTCSTTLAWGTHS